MTINSGQLSLLPNAPVKHDMGRLKLVKKKTKKKNVAFDLKDFCREGSLLNTSNLEYLTE